ncbi:unnamed protein product, partial [marine sediment metagenome]
FIGKTTTTVKRNKKGDITTVKTSIQVRGWEVVGGLAVLAVMAVATGAVGGNGTGSFAGGHDNPWMGFLDPIGFFS